jgi:hypothetical protein
MQLFIKIYTKLFVALKKAATETNLLRKLCGEDGRIA